jgi:hypothetical protein
VVDEKRLNMVVILSFDGNGPLLPGTILEDRLDKVPAPKANLVH